jgi:hypothetical protein
MSIGRNPGTEGRAQIKAERMRAQAEAARAARLAGRPSWLSRVIRRLTGRDRPDSAPR